MEPAKSISVALVILITAHFGFPDPITDVKDLTASLATASGTCIDLLKEMEKIASLTASMLKLTGPLGSLIATSVKIGFPTTSKEYEAITMLNHSMNYRFDKMEVTVQKAAEKMVALAFDIAYKENVEMVIVGIKPSFLDILNPNGCCPESDWTTFSQYCKSERWTPKYGLNYIKTLMDDCEPFEKDDIERLVILRQCLHQLEKRVTHQDTVDGTEWAYIKTVLINSFMKLEHDSFNRRVQRIRDEMENENITNYSALSDKLQNHIPLHLPSKECFLTAAALKNNFRRSALFSHAKILKEDVLTMTIMAGICTNITSNSYAEQQRDLMRIRNIDQAIFKRLEDWLKGALTNTWPKLTEQYIIELLDRSTSAMIAPSEMADVATTIRHTADEMGLQRYHNRVLLMEDTELDYGNWSFITNCSEANCVELRNARGFHIIITRFDFEADISRAQRANAWFIKSAGDMTKAITKWHSTTKNLSNILVDVNWALDHQLEDISRYRNIAFFRREKWLKSHCLFNYANSSVPIRGIDPTENVVIVLINSMITDSFCYALFLFL